MLRAGCLTTAAVLVLGLAGGCAKEEKDPGVVTGTGGPVYSEDQPVIDCSESRKLPDTPDNYDIDAWLQTQKETWHIGDNLSFDWYINYPSFEFTRDWEKYPILNDVVNITGMKPEVQIPSGDGTEKLNTMIATGTLPEVITCDLTDKNVEKLIKGGYVYSYDELIDQYCPDFWKDIPEDVKTATASEIDGKLYGLPGFYHPEWVYKNKLSIGSYTYNVRQDIYEELGRPDMSTPEGLRSALLAFKEKYPEMNGKNSIPLSLGEKGQFIYTLQQSFGMQDYYIHDNKVEIIYKDPQYREMAKYLNGLFRDGLLDREMYIKGYDQVQSDLVNRTFCIPAYFWYLDSANASLTARKEGTNYVSVEPMRAQEDVKFASSPRLGANITLITKECKNPEAVIKFFRYMWHPDGNMFMNYGYQGKDWYVKDGIVYRSEEVANAWSNDFSAYRNQTGMWTFNYFFFKYTREALTESPDRIHDRELADKYCYDNTAQTYKMQPDATTEEGNVQLRIDEIIAKEVPRIVQAGSEAEALANLDNMIRQMESVGLATLEEYWTVRYQKNLDRFGVQF